MSNVIFDQGQAPWDDGTENSPTKTMFGDMDILANNAAGVSYADQLAFYEANPGQQGGGGIGGGVHAKLVAGAAAEKAKQNSGGGYSGGNIGGGAGSYTPPNVNFNPGGIDMGGDSMGGDSWSNEDFIRGLAKERAEAFSSTNQNQSITNNIEQNVGNKGDWETNIGDNNTINNSSIGNDYSLNLGSINVANKQSQFAA